MDNASVVLTRIASAHCTDLQLNPKLWARIQQLASLEFTCFGGGGDLSTDEINLGNSEFLVLNMTFIVKYAAGRHESYK